MTTQEKRSDLSIAPLLLHSPAEACRVLSRVGDVGALFVQWPERFRLTASVLLVKIPTLNEWLQHRAPLFHEF